MTNQPYNIETLARLYYARLYARNRPLALETMRRFVTANQWIVTDERDARGQALYLPPEPEAVSNTQQ